MDPIFNGVIPIIGPEGDSVPLRWEVNERELIICAAPDKGEPAEEAALDAIEEWVAALTAMEVRFEVCKRRHPDRMRPDCVRILRWNGTIDKVMPLLPMELKPHVAAAS